VAVVFGTVASTKRDKFGGDRRADYANANQVCASVHKQDGRGVIILIVGYALYQSSKSRCEQWMRALLETGTEERVESDTMRARYPTGII
jgi:hypothetical protein